MSAVTAPISAPSAEPVIPAPRIVTLATVLVVIGVAALVVPEIWVGFAALVWSAGVLMHLAPTAEIALATVLAVPASWASWQVVRLAFEAETDPENAGQ